MIAGTCCEIRRSRSRNPLGWCSAAFRSNARKSALRRLSETRFRAADTMESREGGMNSNYTEVAVGYGFRRRLPVLVERYWCPVFRGGEDWDDFEVQKIIPPPSPFTQRLQTWRPHNLEAPSDERIDPTGLIYNNLGQHAAMPPKPFPNCLGSLPLKRSMTIKSMTGSVPVPAPRPSSCYSCPLR